MVWRREGGEETVCQQLYNRKKIKKNENYILQPARSVTASLLANLTVCNAVSSFQHVCEGIERSIQS